MAADHTRNPHHFSFMSDNILVKRSPAAVNRRIKRPPPLSSVPPTGRRLGGGGNINNLNRGGGRLHKSSKPLEILKRCKSEPVLLRRGIENGCDRDRDQQQQQLISRTGVETAAVRQQTEFFRSSSEYTLLLLTPSPRKLCEGYNKDAKVVVNVTVEGSPGPIRTMVRLGSSVEEAIRLFTLKYSEEGRTPPLGKDAATNFQLHHSNFSLHCLERRDPIGDAGSRTFFLRKGKGLGDNHWSSSTSSCEHLNSGYIDDDDKRAAKASGSKRHPIAVLIDLIAAKLHKFIRKSRKLCRLLICI